MAPLRCTTPSGSSAAIVIVVDASVVATALGDDGPEGDRVRDRLRAEHRLAAPELLDLEVVSVIRGLERARHLDGRRAGQALADLIRLPLERAPHRALLPRCWELRANLTPYDAAYVALAEALQATLLTADARLARSAGPHCAIEVVASV